MSAADVAASFEAISPEILEWAEIRHEDRYSVRKLVGFTTYSGGWVIPYKHLATDKDTGFVRVRLDTPLCLSDGKYAKYVQAKGSGNHLYGGPGWSFREDNEDLSQILIITEGEKKALLAFDRGIKPCIATAGIWSWGKDGELCSDFDLIKWDGRKVVLLYDSDITHSHRGWPAYYRLAAKLRERGAKPMVLTLPGTGKEKLGLDDFLLRYGVEVWNEWFIHSTKGLA